MEYKYVNDLGKENKALFIDAWNVDYDPEYNFYAQCSEMPIAEAKKNGIELCHVDGKLDSEDVIHVNSKFVYDGLGGSACGENQAYEFFNSTIYVADARSAFVLGKFLNVRVF